MSIYSKVTNIIYNAAYRYIELKLVSVRDSLPSEVITLSHQFEYLTQYPSTNHNLLPDDQCLIVIECTVF